MGAWGSGPLENDSAMDLFGDIMDKIEKIARKKKIGDYGHEEVIAAAAILIRLDPERDYREVAGIFWDKIKTILKDEDWMDSWKVRHEIEDATNDLLKRLGKAYGLK